MPESSRAAAQRGGPGHEPKYYRFRNYSVTCQQAFVKSYFGDFSAGALRYR